MVRSLVSLCFFLAILGCGKGNPNAPASVSGNVTYKGAPVPAGSISFVTKAAGTYSAYLQPDGSYSGSDWPAGDVIVIVETESVNPNVKKEEYKGAKKSNPIPGAATITSSKGMKPGPRPDSAGPPGAPPAYVKIPSKYAKQETSPLKFTIVAGKQTKDWELTD